MNLVGNIYRLQSTEEIVEASNLIFNFNNEHNKVSAILGIKSVLDSVKLHQESNLVISDYYDDLFVRLVTLIVL